MKSLIACLLGSIAALVSHASEKSFTEIVSEDVDLLLYARSFSETRTTWEDHPLGKVFADKSVREFFEPMFDHGELAEADVTKLIQDEFGLDWEELNKLFPGQAALAIFNVPEMMLEKDDLPDIAIMADFSGSEERLNELMKIQFERNANTQKEANSEIEHEMKEEVFMGETLYFDEVFDGEETSIEDGYALVDGIFVIATEERLRTTVEAIKKGTDRSLANNAAYRRFSEDADDSDIVLYINMESLMPPLNSAMQDQALQGGLAMFGVTAKSLDAALQLEAIEAFGFSLKLTKDGAIFHSALTYREKAGIVKLVAYGEGSLPKAPYVPEKILSSSVSLFDMSQMFTQLEALIGTASPSAPALIDIKMQDIKRQTGIDLRTAILKNFGPEVVSLSVMPEGARTDLVFQEPDQLFVIKIKDAETLSSALEAAMDMIPGARSEIKTQEFKGETIHTISGMADPTEPDSAAQDVSYVITRTHLIFNIGSVGLIQQVLSAMQSESSGFWQLPEIEAHFDSIAQDNPINRSYIDLSQMIRAILLSIVEVSQTGLGQPLDASKIPESLTLPYVIVTEMNETTDGLFNRSHLILKKDSK